MAFLIAGLVLVALAIFVAVFAAFAGAGQATGVARSLELVNFRPTGSDVVRSELGARERLSDPLLHGFRSLGLRLSPSGTAGRISRNLERAGNPSGWTLERVMGAKGLGLIVGALLGVLLLGISVRGILLALALAAFGFFLPDLLVYNGALRRQDQIRRGLPDAVDMLTVCVEAGQGFDAAILQVARTVPGPIGQEFARLLSEVQIGMSRRDAFAAMGERTAIPEMKNFISAIVQADRMGLPIAVVLREQTKEMRVVRRQRAEEKAQKVTVKILFPLLLCIFPALFIVIIGPGIIRMIDVFSRL